MKVTVKIVLLRTNEEDLEDKKNLKCHRKHKILKVNPKIITSNFEAEVIHSSITIEIFRSQFKSINFHVI